MAGIYIHIPFCKSRCKYCDFFSTTHLEKQAQYVEALLAEGQMRQHEVQLSQPQYRENMRSVNYDQVLGYREYRRYGVDRKDDI